MINLLKKTLQGHIVSDLFYYKYLILWSFINTRILKTSHFLKLSFFNIFVSTGTI